MQVNEVQTCWKGLRLSITAAKGDSVRIVTGCSFSSHQSALNGQLSLRPRKKASEPGSTHYQYRLMSFGGLNTTGCVSGVAF